MEIGSETKSPLRKGIVRLSICDFFFSSPSGAWMFCVLLFPYRKWRSTWRAGTSSPSYKPSTTFSRKPWERVSVGSAGDLAARGRLVPALVRSACLPPQQSGPDLVMWTHCLSSLVRLFDVEAHTPDDCLSNGERPVLNEAPMRISYLFQLSVPALCPPLAPPLLLPGPRSWWALSSPDPLVKLSAPLWQDGGWI